MTGVSITTTPNTSFASYYSPYNYSPYNYSSSLTSSDYTELETKSYYELKVGKIVRRGTKVTTYKSEKNIKNISFIYWRRISFNHTIAQCIEKSGDKSSSSCRTSNNFWVLCSVYEIHWFHSYMPSDCTSAWGEISAFSSTDLAFERAFIKKKYFQKVITSCTSARCFYRAFSAGTCHWLIEGGIFREYLWLFPLFFKKEKKKEVRLPSLFYWYYLLYTGCICKVYPSAV